MIYYHLHYQGIVVTIKNFMIHQKQWLKWIQIYQERIIR